MKALIIGCGRVGSSIALQLDREGWDVVAVDEKEEALTRLGSHWNGGFIVGHGMDVDVLRSAGIEEAEAGGVAADRGNTKLPVRARAQKSLRNPCGAGPGLRPAPPAPLQAARPRSPRPPTNAA